MENINMGIVSTVSKNIDFASFKIEEINPDIDIWNGINDKDIKNVFKKSFTGENGRNLSKSTGMGLYIAKKLCDKLGHKILIESEKNKYTIVKIIFGENNYYKIDN